jgi:hypothetical protein
VANTSPASNPPAVPAGTATITGSLTSSPTTRLAAADGIRTLDVSGLTVTVVGSNVSSRVDGAGRFVLTNVPSGDIRLRFAGNGVDVNLAISAVRNGDQITITVTITGNGATLDRMTREGERDADDDGDEDEKESERQQSEIEIEGTISAGTCASFTLNGSTVTTNAATIFRNGSCADIKAGAKVEVEGTRSGSAIVATRIEVKGLEQNREVELEGRVTAATGCASFTVNGTVVTTNSATQFRNGSCADIKPNVKVEVKGTRTGTNTVVATRVDIDK